MISFVSTRGGNAGTGFVEALERGLAPDGGLYVPQSLPRVEALQGADSFPAVAQKVLAPFCEGTALAAALPEICREAFDFPVPLVPIEGGPSLLELFQGPTAAFKDAGARFLARALSRLPLPAAGRRTVLVATSGDTGGAVAAAFQGLAGFRVAVFFPEKGVSSFQRRQLTCWGGNVRSFAVHGTFDDCQRIVKEAFGDPAWSAAAGATSANSINLGRLLPQAAFHAAAAVWFKARTGRDCRVIVPSGNLGHAVAALYARAMGAPILQVGLALNANRTVKEFMDSGTWKARASVATLANAMDVGNPSNGERLSALIPDLKMLQAAVRAQSVSDDEIRTEVRRAWSDWRLAVCPHTATGLRFWRDSGWADAIVAATAHPAKFRETLDAEKVPVDWPPALERLLNRPVREERLSADVAALKKAVDSEKDWA